MWIPRRQIAGSYGNSVLNFLRNLHTVFHSGCTQHCVRFALHILCHFLSYLSIIFLTGVKQYLIVVLICISNITSGVEHSFIYLVAICMPSLENYLFSSSGHFLIRFFFVKLCEFFTYFGYQPLMGGTFANIFSQVNFDGFFCCAETSHFDVI